MLNIKAQPFLPSFTVNDFLLPPVLLLDHGQLTASSRQEDRPWGRAKHLCYVGAQAKKGRGSSWDEGTMRYEFKKF